jgi:hypothetical protein
MNLGELGFNETCASTLISDLTVVLDRTITPPFLFMSQYYGDEDVLRGGIRTMEPQLAFIYEFDCKCWSIIDGRSSSSSSSNVQSSHLEEIFKKFNYKFVLTDDLEKTNNRVMSYLKIIKH